MPPRDGSMLLEIDKTDALAGRAMAASTLWMEA